MGFLNHNMLTCTVTHCTKKKGNNSSYKYDIITSSGPRSNVFPAIVNETVGNEERLLQSTADSPIGLGSRSQSCNRKHMHKLAKQRAVCEVKPEPKLLYLISIIQNSFCSLILCQLISHPHHCHLTGSAHRITKAIRRLSDIHINHTFNAHAVKKQMSLMSSF